MQDNPYVFDIALQDRVSRGVEWLDENAPAGWWDLIDYGLLDISDGNVCILGQVFAAKADETGMAGGYIYAESTFSRGTYGERNLPVIALGFCGSDFEYEKLRLLWIDAVENRRAEVNA